MQSALQGAWMPKDPTYEAFYCTVEAYSWSRYFDYANYVSAHQRSGCTHKKLTPEGYAEFCTMMHNEMRRYFEQQEREEDGTGED